VQVRVNGRERKNRWILVITFNIYHLTFRPQAGEVMGDKRQGTANSLIFPFLTPTPTPTLQSDAWEKFKFEPKFK